MRARMKARLLLGHRRGGDVEGGAADDAHHLVLDVRERGLGSAAAAGAAERQREDEDEKRAHSLSVAPAG